MKIGRVSFVFRNCGRRERKGERERREREESKHRRKEWKKRCLKSEIEVRWRERGKGGENNIGEQDRCRSTIVSRVAGDQNRGQYTRTLAPTTYSSHSSNDYQGSAAASSHHYTHSIAGGDHQQ